MQSYRRTKLIATIGPASRAPERVRAMIEAGANVFRLNFSHGSHQEHATSLETIRTISKEMGAPVAVLQDLSGPKIRISNVKGDFVEVVTDEIVTLYATHGPCCSSGHDIFVETVNPHAVLEPEQRVLLADGLIELKVHEVSPSGVKCVVVKGGRIRSRVGIAFPDSHVDLPATTDKDLVDLEWGLKNGVDYVAISFVKNGADISRLRKHIAETGGHEPHIIAKIERKVALKNIDEILEEADGLMVARGDLGLDLPIEQVPLVQRQLIEKANYRGKPVIVATQMMHSMITSPRPSRAEVSDIATAVMTGADAVMLSDETTIGEHPVEAVRYLGLISQEAEKAFEFEEYRLHLRDADRETVPDSVAYAACAASLKVGARAIIVLTESGTSARLVAKYRPHQPLYGVSGRENTFRRMALYRGVIPVLRPALTEETSEVQLALECVRENSSLGDSDLIAITGGIASGQAGSTSVLHIRKVVP